MHARALLAALLVAGCLGAPRPAPAPSSGFFGAATLGPTCPVAREPPDPACADKPYVGNLSLLSADGSRPVLTFSTDAEGRFNVSAPPDAYSIGSAGARDPYPDCTTGPFRVVAGGWTNVTVRCDTGIR